MPLSDNEFVEALKSQGLMDEKALKSFVAQQKVNSVPLEQLFFEREVIPDEKLGKLVAGLYGVPYIKLGDKAIASSLLRIVPYTLASHQFLIPFEHNVHELHVALNDPKNYELINFLEKKTGLTVHPYYATKKDIQSALKAYHSDVNQKFTNLLKGALSDPTKIESLKDAAKILDTIILFAYQNKASDIHIEPHKHALIVRYRIDGILHTITEFPLEISDLLVTRVKVLANLRTDEHRSAQDGRFKIDLEGSEITLRVSIIPVYDGEKTVMRILSSANQQLDLESLGYVSRNLNVIHNTIAKTHGIILITGPTGSGKTTTLYSVLKILNSPEVNISTIEDPIEYRLEGVNQIQVNPKTNLTFAAGLRSLLRQDPDIIMVGEIRDQETSHIAINAALTGHLVLATLHTNDAASTLPRMMEMGVEPFLLAATAQLVVAQRLVRTICSQCKTQYDVSFDQLRTLQKKLHVDTDLIALLQSLTHESNPKLTFSRGNGCSICNSTGFKGRTCISEVLEVTDNMQKLILKNPSPQELEQSAVSEGMTTLFTDGIQKVLSGITTIEEVLRVMRS